MDIDVADAKYRLLAMGDQAHSGEDVVITKDGQPWLRLTPCTDYKPLPKLQSESRGSPPEDEDFSLPEWAWPMVLAYEHELCAECLAKTNLPEQSSTPKTKGAP